LDKWRENENLESGRAPPPDHFEKLVAHALKRELKYEQPEMKFEKGPEIETKDVTDQIKAVDVTEEMRMQFDSGSLKD